MEEGLIYDWGLKGEGSGFGRRAVLGRMSGILCLINDAKREYLIDQSEQVPLYLQWMDSNCP